MENKKLTTSLVAGLLLATNLYSNELSSVTVTSATKSDQSIQDVTSNVEVITKEEIEEKNFTTIVEALNTISGISYKAHGSLGASSSVFLRGMDNHRTLVLIDGVRYQDPSNSSGANFSHIMINDIERIEVIKGAQSGIWGADAAAGVINIITKRAKKGTHGSVNFEAGSFNTKKYGTTISHGTEKFDVKFSANKVESDGFSNATPYGDDPKEYERDGYKNTTISFDTNYYITDNSKLSFAIKDIDAFAEYDSKNTPNDTSMKSDVDTTLYDVVYNHQILNHNIKLKYQLSKFKRFEDGTVATPGFTFNGTFYPGSENVLVFNGENQNIELNDEFRYKDNSFLIFGGGASQDDVKFTMTDDTKKQKNSKSKYIYLTNSNRFDKAVITQSLRYDAYKNFDNKLTGKIGFKYNIDENLNFFTNVGTGYNVPSILKEFNPWGSPNFDLQPEETKTLDLGMSYKDLSLTVFKSEVYNLIDWEGTGYTNISGKSRFKGAEIAYKKAINSDTLLGLNYTYLSAKEANGDRLIRRPKRKLNFSFDYYGFKDFHINVNGEYIGDRLDDKDTQTGNYTLWNSVINYKINQNLDTYLKVDNVFDKYYQSSLTYSSAPRSAYVGLRYTF